MPVIFEKHEGRWATRLLPGSPRRHELAGAALLMRTTGSGHEPQWALLVRAGAHVMHNGQPVAAGLRVLAHRDALALGGEAPLFFSTEAAASIEPFSGADTVICPRCRDAIAPGAPAVKCPGCGVVHHEASERNCWTYARTCALCAQPTALDAGLQWTPAGL